MKKVIILFGILTQAFSLYATLQAREVIDFNNKTYYIDQYLMRQNASFNQKFMEEKENLELGLFYSISNCWRGYVGHWEIKNDSLFFVKFESPFHNKPDYNQILQKKKYFNIENNADLVFSDWVERELYLDDYVLKIEKGIVTNILNARENTFMSRIENGELKTVPIIYNKGSSFRLHILIPAIILILTVLLLMWKSNRSPETI